MYLVDNMNPSTFSICQPLNTLIKIVILNCTILHLIKHSRSKELIFQEVDLTTTNWLKIIKVPCLKYMQYVLMSLCIKKLWNFVFIMYYSVSRIAFPQLKFMNVEQNVSFIHVLIRTLHNNLTQSENKMKKYIQKHYQHENRKPFPCSCMNPRWWF